VFSNMRYKKRGVGMKWLKYKQYLMFILMVISFSSYADEFDDLVTSDTITTTISPIPDDEIKVADPYLPVEVQKEAVVQVPLFGPMTFKISDNAAEGMYIEVPSREVGPVALRNMRFSLIHGILSLKGKASLFNLTADVGLLELVYDQTRKFYRAVFGFRNFSTPLKIRLSPTDAIELTDLNLVVELRAENATGKKTSFKDLADASQARTYFVAKSTFLGSPVNFYITRRGSGWIYSLKIPQLTPFSNITLQGYDAMRNVKLHDIIAQFNTLDEAMGVDFKGTADFFSVRSKAHFYFGTTKTKSGVSKTSAFVELSFNEGDKVSKLIPDLKGTVFDDFIIKGLAVLISSEYFEDTKRGVEFVQGINLYGAVGLPTDNNKELGQVSKLVGVGDMVLFCGISLPNPLNSSVLVRMPNAAIKIAQDQNQNFRFDHFDLSIKGGTSFSVGVAVALSMKPSPQDEWLTFTGGFKVSPLDATLSANLDGGWRNPFGIKPIRTIEIRDVALELKVNYVMLSAGIPISGLGFGFQFCFGRTSLKAAVKFDATHPEKSLFYTEAKNLGICDLADFASMMTTIPIRTDDIPDIRLEKFKLYIAPVKTEIGSRIFEQGISCACSLIVPVGDAAGTCGSIKRYDNTCSAIDLGQKPGEKILFNAEVSFSIFDQGVKGNGYCKAFTIGELTVTGKGKPGSNEEGPYLEFEFSPVKNKFYLTSFIKYSDLFSQITEIYFDHDSFSTLFETKIKDTIDATVEINSNLQYLQLYALIDFRMYFIANTQKMLDTYADSKGFPRFDVQQLQQQIKPVMTDLKNQIGTGQYFETVKNNIPKTVISNEQRAKEAIEKANRRISALDDKRKEIDMQIAAREKALLERIAKMEQQIQKNIDERLAKQQSAIAAREKALGDKIKQVDQRTKASEDKLTQQQKAREEKLAQDQKALEDRVAHIGTKKPAVTKSTTAVTQQTQPQQTQTASKPTQTQTTPQPISAPQPFSQSVQTYNSAQSPYVVPAPSLDMFGQMIGGAFMQLGQEIEKNIAAPITRVVSAMLGAFRLDKFYFRGDLAEVVRGVFPKVQLEVCTSGVQRIAVFQLDVNKLDQSAMTIAGSMINLFGPAPAGAQSC